jgi:hypothetical protein
MCAFLPRGVRVQTSAELSVLIYDVFISVWPSRAGALRAHIHIGRVGEGGRQGTEGRRSQQSA